MEVVTQQRKLTLGEFRVGISFNPGGHEQVNAIKKTAADLIDYLEAQRNEFNMSFKGKDTPEGTQLAGEVNRLISLSQTHIEDAAMWGVKAVTKS